MPYHSDSIKIYLEILQFSVLIPFCGELKIFQIQIPLPSPRESPTKKSALGFECAFAHILKNFRPERITRLITFTSPLSERKMSKMQTFHSYSFTFIIRK